MGGDPQRSGSTWSASTRPMKRPAPGVETGGTLAAVFEAARAPGKRATLSCGQASTALNRLPDVIRTVLPQSPGALAAALDACASRYGYEPSFGSAVQGDRVIQQRVLALPECVALVWDRLSVIVHEELVRGAIRAGAKPLRSDELFLLTAGCDRWGKTRAVPTLTAELWTAFQSTICSGLQDHGGCACEPCSVDECARSIVEVAACALGLELD